MAKTGHSGGRRMQRCSNRGSSIGAGSSSSDSGSRVGWSVVSGMPDIKIPQTLAFHVPGQPLRCPTLPSSRFTYNPFPRSSRPSSVILLLLSVRSILLASARSFPYPISFSLYRSLLLHFPRGFPRRIFRHPCRKPSYPHFPSRYLAHLPTSFGARAARRCLWNHVGITRMPRCVQCIHEPYARILNRLPQHSAQARLLGSSCQEPRRL